MLDMFTPTQLSSIRRAVIGQIHNPKVSFDTNICSTLKEHLDSARREWMINIETNSWMLSLLLNDLHAKMASQMNQRSLRLYGIYSSFFQGWRWLLNCCSCFLQDFQLLVYFLNVILAPLFTNKNQRLQGPNAKLDVGQSKSSDGHATTSRPDTAVVELQGVHAGATKVFGEVKAAHITNDTYLLSEDLLRFGVFAKGAIDNDQLSTVLTFQAVGLKITFFAVTLIGDGMYAMVELEKITIPNCINDVSSFLGCVQPLMNILSVMKSCIPSPFPNELKDMGRPTLSTPEFRSLINKSRDRKRISYINYT